MSEYKCENEYSPGNIIKLTIKITLCDILYKHNLNKCNTVIKTSM